ncbi:MAG: SHOCT domain-containing protein [Roseiarcus sp.]|jgi:hypothetical protein
MPELTPEGARVLEEIAGRHGVGVDAARAVLDALARGGGSQAQFNHPDLGGMGQWSQGGMSMIGDMFNHGLKHRVDALCNELVGLLRSQPAAGVEARRAQIQSQAAGMFASGWDSPGRWWPAELGEPASSGAQNDMRYAFFPESRRLAIQQGGRVRVYDAGDHRLSGFSQRQGGDQSLSFNSQFGLVSLADLPLISPREERAADAAPSPSPLPPAAPPPAAAPVASSLAAAEILKTLEGLAELRRKDILTEAEFAAKKAQLLSRL